ncbi:hypothetical protein LAV84_25685 [Rhizobium sp. VS19-DR104.2]|uniref:hypothetical protein n=1 Tax=unclassified Rhizobium TaxID=2613769 RepID=UPI001CC6C769|nr:MULTISPECIES: hypothetical protein [unclassified Rhizobium]MBZ5762938.1 hypothetical protein [Rhizobium sp. VS19-DR96]MBZ5768771.1 hypothetical protein [Rhizobium sp. VS19-DR129.2]MBZ5776387.1 hypothetical protein [Rhizobium sp. VS19-DRK62.2]MBZ5787594.1 hypothetical protein [Rhizobium sp. VS19-DR121]MBZ5804949.1 hypothetical protein [Rhizobium sp. VS19-DR181]
MTIIAVLSSGTFAWLSLHEGKADNTNLPTARVVPRTLTETVNANGILEPSRRAKVVA